MNSLEFSFADSPWELFAEKLHRGERLSAAQFLTMTEGEDEETLEEAFRLLEERAITLDISDLPRSVGNGEAALRLRRESQLVRQGNLLTALDEFDPLRLYLEELASIPVCGDEEILAAECAKGKESSREKLMNMSLSRVVQIAEEYVDRGVLLLDLIQEGSMGLWQGILCYCDGMDYSASRDWWIRQAMAKLVTLQARDNGVGQKMRQALEDYRAVDERLLADLGRNPTLEEIALELHMTPEEADLVKKMLDSARLVSQAKQAAEPEEAPEEEERHVEDTALFQARQRIMDLLSGLSEEDAKLLTMRFGLEGGLPMSPEETGRKLGLTPEEVVAREAAALAQLRNG